MEFTSEEAQEVVSTYRTTYPGIPEFWSRATNMLLWTLDKYKSPRFQIPCIFNTTITLSGLPNGMKLVYPKICRSWLTSIGIPFSGKHEYTWGGKITENIVQALSRIVITDGLMRIHTYLRDLGGSVVLTVHDEIVCIAPETDATTVLRQDY